MPRFAFSPRAQMIPSTHADALPDTLRALVDANSDGVVVVGVDGRIEHVNRHAREMVGMTTAEIVGRPFHTFFGDSMRDRAMACFSSVPAHREVLEATRLSVDGRNVRDIELRARRIEDGRTIAVLRDVGDLRRHQRALHLVSYALSERPGQTFFDALVQALGRALGVDYAFIGELVDDERVKIHSLVGPEGLKEPVVYSLARTPCEIAVRERRSVFTARAREEFPEDPMLQELDIRTYQAIPILDDESRAIGILGILNRTSRDEDPLVSSTLNLVASRVSAEIRQRRTEEERRRAERHLRALMQASTRFVWGVDAEGRPTLGTMSAWSEATGWSREDVPRPWEWLDAVHPDDRDRARRAWTTAMQEERDFDTEYRVSGPEGTRHLHVRGIPIHDDDGVFEGFIGTIDDVSEPRQAAEDLRRRNQVLRALRAVPEATHNGAGFIESIQVGMTEICSVSGFELGRLRMQDAVDGPFRYSGVWSADPSTDMDRTLAAELPSPLDHRPELAQRVEALDAPVFLSRTLLGDGTQEGRGPWGGECTAVFVPVRHENVTVAILELLARDSVECDDTLQEVMSQIALQLGRAYERETTQRQMREAERQARESQKLEAVGRLAGGIAHDFNNLLMVVLGEADLALRVDDVPEQVATALGEIREAARRASSLTGQLLAFSRKELESPERISLCELVRSADRMLHRIIGENVELIVRGTESVATCDVEIARGLMEQVLVNLVVNAREAMPAGGTIDITVSSEWVSPSRATSLRNAQPGEYVVLSVADTGTGIAEEIRESIFDPFFTTKDDGTGFGLSTSYGIVTAAGGFIDFRTTVGAGTEFRVYLPMAVPAEGMMTVTAPPPVTQPRGSRRVLVVEDDDGVRSVAVRILNAAGYDVTAARGIDEVDAYLETVADGPEVLVTDCVLEKATGREIENRTKERFPEVATVFMSGYTDDVLLSQGVQPEGSAFLAKPFSPEALVESVERVLAESRMDRRATDDGRTTPQSQEGPSWTRK